MIRTMIDSDKVDALGQHTHIVATYSDLVHDFDAYRKAHPHQRALLIDRGIGDPTGEATIMDIEPHAMKAADVPGWFDRKHAAGKEFLTAYSDRNDYPAIVHAAGARKLWHWIATLDGTMHIDGFTPLHGPAAVQILGASQTGLSVDFSVVLEDAWNPAPNALNLHTARHLVEASAADIQSAAHQLARVRTLLAGA